MKEYKLLNVDSRIVWGQVRQDFPLHSIHFDKEIKLFDEYIRLLFSGRKTSTIRFKRGFIRLPISYTIPLIETKRSMPEYRKNIGNVTLEKMVVKQYEELDKRDAFTSGFDKLDTLRTELTTIYGKIYDKELVSIYYIKKEERKPIGVEVLVSQPLIYVY